MKARNRSKRDKKKAQQREESCLNCSHKLAHHRHLQEDDTDCHATIVKGEATYRCICSKFESYEG